MRKNDVFSSRWGLILAVLGLAVGTGNIWRFPRMVAQNGGGAFLIPWLIFFVIWSIPLLVIEMSLGKKFRVGTIGVFHEVIGKKYSWMGAFIGVTASAIMFYYSVVTGWCLKYFLIFIFGLSKNAGTTTYWNSFTDSYQPLVFHFFSMVAAGVIVWRGIQKGIEWATRIMVPSIWIILAVCFGYILFQPGSFQGIVYLFNPDWNQLLNYNTWLNALTQTAWSTGAGWGLLLTYAVYSRKREDIVLNSYITGFGNNSVSLLAALVIFPTVFAFIPAGLSPELLMKESGPASTGLTFIWMPRLFDSMPAGHIIGALFFFTVLVAAFSSLIAMLELMVRNLEDLGVDRKKGVWIMASIGFAFGVPSAVDINFLTNQDWVWSVGLLLSGFFFALLARKYGVRRFRKECVNIEGNELRIGIWFEVVVKYFIPVEFIVVVAWWFWQSWTMSGEPWWNPFGNWSIGTCLFQWLVVIIVFVLLGELIHRRLQLREASDAT